MADKIQNWRGVKIELSVVGLLIESLSDSDDESEGYNDENVLMEIVVSRWCTSATKVLLSNIARAADAFTRHLHWDLYVVEEAIPWFFQFVRQFHTLVFHYLKLISDCTLDTLLNLMVHWYTQN